MDSFSTRAEISRPGSYRFGTFDLHPADRQLRQHGHVVAVPPKVFDALSLFVEHADRLVRKEQLVEALWPGTFVTDASVTNVIGALRKIVGREAIATVPKHGYRFTIPLLGTPAIAPSTYETFAQAKALVKRRSVESMTHARALFTLCVADDPGFADAWAWLGRTSRFLDKFEGRTPVDLRLAQAALQRALAVEPDLPAGHHFYAQLQIDLGESHDAAVRLVARLARHGDEPESYAGLVHALRFCGLLDESIAAHQRALALDPAVITSVAHSYFLRGDFEAVLATYGGTGYYLDAAARAALGDVRYATRLLDQRLAATDLSPLMRGLLGSLRYLLADQRQAALDTMAATPVEREPEVLFYFARHHALLGATTAAVALLRQARAEGFTSATSLRRDRALARLRGVPGFAHEVREADAATRAVAHRLDDASGGRLARLLAPTGRVDVRSRPRRSV